MRPLDRPRLATRCVVVVEDELLLRIALAEELRAVGVRVIETGTADEAWDYLRAVGGVDLIFSDICMPGSMGGIDLARRVKERFPDLSVILTSGSHNFHEPGIKFLAKPYEFDRAVQLILDALPMTGDGTACDTAQHG